MGPVMGPHTRTNSTPDTRVAEPRLPAPGDERPREGQRLTPDAPHSGGRSPPLGTAPHHPHGAQPTQGMQAKRTVQGPHNRTTAPTASEWRTATARPEGGQSGGGGGCLTSDASHDGERHPPPGKPFCHPHSAQRHPSRAHAMRPVLGPQARTNRTRDTRAAELRLPAPEDGRQGEGQRLTPDAPHRACKPRGQCWAPTPAHPRPQQVGGGGGAPDPRRPSQRRQAPPTGAPLRRCPQGRTP